MRKEEYAVLHVVHYGSLRQQLASHQSREWVPHFELLETSNNSDEDDGVLKLTHIH